MGRELFEVQCNKMHIAEKAADGKCTRVQHFW
jgi:hypothetical protein